MDRASDEVLGLRKRSNHLRTLPLFDTRLVVRRGTNVSDGPLRMRPGTVERGITVGAHDLQRDRPWPSTLPEERAPALCLLEFPVPRAYAEDKL